MGAKQLIKGLVCGFGINDSNYPTNPFVNGVRVCCPFYRVWSSMLKRCYSKSSLKHRPTYAGCSVDSRWVKFMDFRAWMITQDWEGKQLDKDLLVQGNKIYGPDTCIFVSKEVNQFMNEKANSRGDYPIGVSWVESSGKNYAANCHRIGKGTEYLGVYDSPEEAHLAYIQYKEKLASDLASIQTDPKVSNALSLKYCKTKLV